MLSTNLLFLEQFDQYIQCLFMDNKVIPQTSHLPVDLNVTLTKDAAEIGILLYCIIMCIFNVYTVCTYIILIEMSLSKPHGSVCHIWLYCLSQLLQQYTVYPLIY